MKGVLVTIFFFSFFKLIFTDSALWNQSTVDNGGFSSGRSVAVGVSDRWKVTCDT